VFEVIPAIDVSGGVLASMTSTGTRPVSAFAGDPVAAAESAARNLDVLTEIAALPVSVQAAGGVREASHVEALLAAGATRVVLGSAALAEERRASALISAEAERLVIGIEEDGGRIRSRGRTPVDLPLMETLAWVVSAGASALLVTSVHRVGDRGGPDLELVRRVVRAGRPVLAAGGIASLDDLRALRAAGAVGAVVGTAVLDGSLDLSAAVAELSGNGGTAL